MRSLVCLIAPLALACQPGAPERANDAREEAGTARDGALPSVSNDAARAPDAAQTSDSDAGAQSVSARDAAAPQGASAASADASQGDAGHDAGKPEAGAARCASPGLCTDFEDEAPGALAGMWSARAPNCSGDGKATIDEQVARSGKRSLRVQSSGGTCNHVFATPTLDFAALGDAFWVRFYVRFESALTDAHVTFLAMQDQVSNKALRMGGQKKILMWNRESDDATLPELSPNGIGMSVAPKPGQFQCVEFHLDGPAGALETYVDGQQVPGLVIDGSATHDIDGQWLRNGKWTAKVSEIGFGWESYGGEAMLLWYDDIAIARERPGC
jgi:hypothetical protein